MQHILSIFVLFVCACVLASCGGSKKGGMAEAVTGDEIPAMITYNDSMTISDSGVIKYRAKAPVWIRFGDEAEEPYQYFPEGIRFEQIAQEGEAFAAQQTIVADTAYNWEKSQIWRLISNVRINSVKGEYFETSELYWDMHNHTVYSDSFIHIERADNILEGYGFNSNDDFSQYEIRQTSGIFPAREQNGNTNTHPESPDMP